MREKKLLQQIAANTKAQPRASIQSGGIRRYKRTDTGAITGTTSLFSTTVAEDRVLIPRSVSFYCDRTAGAAAGDAIYMSLADEDAGTFAWYVHSQAPDVLEHYAFSPGISHTATGSTLNVDPLPNFVLFSGQAWSITIEYGANTGRVWSGWVTWYDYSLDEWSARL